MRETILYIATSADGYIAAPGDDLTFLAAVEEQGQDYGYARFIAGVDTVIMGRKTYDWVLAHVPQFVHADKSTFVVTRTPRPTIGSTRFYTGEVRQLVRELKSKPGKNIFIDGGAELVNYLMHFDLIDVYILSVIPVFLGRGIRLFQDGRPEQGLEFISVKSYPKGLVQMHYRRAKG